MTTTHTWHSASSIPARLASSEEQCVFMCIRRARSTRSAWQHGSKDRKTGQHGSSALTRMLSTQSQGAPSHRMRTGISQDAHGLSRARSLALPHFSTLQPLMPASTAVRDWINKHEHT
eukprot:1162151-Pelagomonas_calceolata.AAC.16